MLAIAVMAFICLFLLFVKRRSFRSLVFSILNMVLIALTLSLLFVPFETYRWGDLSGLRRSMEWKFGYTSAWPLSFLASPYEGIIQTRLPSVLAHSVLFLVGPFLMCVFVALTKYFSNRPFAAPKNFMLFPTVFWMGTNALALLSRQIVLTPQAYDSLHWIITVLSLALAYFILPKLFRRVLFKGKVQSVPIETDSGTGKATTPESILHTSAQTDRPTDEQIDEPTDRQTDKELVSTGVVSVAVIPGQLEESTNVAASNSAYTATTIVLEARGLSKTYDMGATQVKAVDGVSLTVGRGEFLVIMGKSGSGKSTLLHLLGGLDRPDAGEVRINDTVITSMKEEQLSKFRARHLGFVFQFFYLLPELTAAENICLPLLVNRSQQNLNEREITALTDLLGITERLEHRPEQLSGGEQQRVALARALANRPEIIMLDEPTGNLDSRSTEQIMRMIAELVSTRTQTVIMVTHDRDWCDLADRVLYMRDGHLVDAATYASEQGGRHA